MFYAARGSIPPKRHTQHRAPDGSLYAEELFGVEGFTGRSSLLYHVTPPTQTHLVEEPAVMVDTFHPLRITRQAAAMEDARYPYQLVAGRRRLRRGPRTRKPWAGGVPGLKVDCEYR